MLLVCSMPAPGLPAHDFVPSQKSNMNGAYHFSTTPGGTAGLFPKQYKDYPGGVETFDVLSPPMTTLYSQVWWAPLAPSPFPQDVVQKWAGKKMAIVGWEIDQVRRLPDGSDVSVPINANYNHHYVASIVGGSARFRQVQLDGPHDPRAADLAKLGHGYVQYDQPQWVVEGKAALNNAAFSSANGGEYRKTYHGFAPGHALVIDSPTAMQISPMQIDTWNRREMDISGPLPPKFVPGPLPRASAAPKEDPMYSALLECPMTTRLSKHVDGGYVAQSEGACGEPILSFQECFAAAAATISAQGPFHNATVSDASKPSGCSAALVGGEVRVYYNSAAAAEASCAANASAVSGSVASLVEVSVSLDAAKDLALISLRGPAAVWMGAAFGAHAMADKPWTIVADGNGGVSEVQLGNHVAGAPLSASVQIRSNTVAGGVRTVVVSRRLAGASASHYTFRVASADATVPILTAVGSAAAYAYHKDKSLASLTLLPVGGAAVGGAAAACVCPQAPAQFGEATGQLVYHRDTNQSADVGTGAVGFGRGKCAPYPATDLLNQRNPTCDIRYYKGGQWACHHMWSLLDADQPIPWADQPLVMHHKYRFWVQPYDPAVHTPLVLGEHVGSALLIGSPWEYDVPKCAAGVAGCSLEGGSWVHTLTGGTVGRHTFAALNFHCHAPTCLSMAVYACAKGTPLPACNATVGKLLCKQEPLHGRGKGEKFDEAGYIAIPDCFWGDAAYGLEPPVDLTGVPLHMVKTSDATYGHYGEMAGGQPWVFSSSAELALS